MSDIEEMDSEQLNELESILYASIHYNDATREQEQQALDMELDAQSMPPPPQQQHPEQKQQQQKQLRFVSDKRIINNGTSKPRYWAEAKSDVASDNGALKAKTSTLAETPNTEQPKEAPVAPPASNVDVVATPKNKRSEANSPKKPTPQQKQPKAPNPVKQLLQKQQQMRQALKMQQVQKRQQPQIQQKPPKPAPQQQNNKANAYDEPERFDQRLLVAIPSNCGPKAKREPVGPFAKSNRKLEQFQKLATKKQKSMRAQTNKKLKQIKGQPIEMISLVDSSDHSDTDDVIIVPLPPVPIIDVDASDEEQAPAAYIEENAMDAADVSLSGGDCATTQMTVVRSVMHSPCSSVLSSDDFIVQKDTSRLIADRARATDEDLLVLTENAIRNAADPECEDTTAEPEKAADTSSEYEFVPPSRLEEIKQNYRVDEQQFRALDVYESESDLTEGGIYCKAKQKFAPTIIRTVDSESESSDVEQVIEVNVNKTKRLRKRRASSTNQSQSDPNNEADKDNEDDDTDSDVDGVHATGVPGISRGMALERCKRKIRRISQRRSSESALQAVPRKMEDTNDASSDSATEESLPTARQIAERLLMQKQANEKEQKQEKEMEEEREEEEDEAMDSVGSDANTEDEAEMHNVSEQMSKVFERIDQNTKLSQAKQIEPEKKPQIDAISADQDLDQISEDELELSSETDAEAEDVVQVEHNMSELKEQLSGGDLVGWNEEMCRFYNDSWGGENFNLHRIQRAMSSLRSDWRVINADRFPTARKRSNLKCNNCFEMGHMRAKCPRPRKPVVCFTCGMPGHAEPRCPNAICLGCGAKQPLYVQKCNKCSIQSRMICQLCKMRGHSIDMCPDKWRRYHSTTRSNVELESKVQYRQKNCSYCAARGHLFEDCRQRLGEYRHTNYTQRIISHQKVYKDRPEPISYSSDLDNFFSLDIPFHFNWSSEFSKNSIYARFLKAVGLPRPVDKRKVSGPPMQLKLYTHDYVPNPAASAALGKAPTTTASVIIEELPAETQATPETVTEVSAVEAEVQPEAETDNNTNQLSSDVIATTIVKPTVPLHDLDSDSNYSFSEHFEVPAEKVSTPPKPTKTGPMENLPDVIPLNSIADDNSDNNNDNDEQMSISSGNNQGISMCVNSKTVTEDQPQSLPDLPSEAKIIMARDQTEYLFSPEGREFLATAAKQCNVNVRMDFKEYGYVLVIYGLKKDQEDLQIRLLRRNQEVMRKSSDFQSQKPPKRVDVLIRFMRDGINSLSSDLGNAKNHYHRIKQLEEMNTKNGFKQAERKRRLLNMILIGQAGLSNGSMHLDQLLSILKRLLDEHSGDENATPALRSEIEEHWRFIFSPNPHPNYDLLLENYSRLDTKNRMTALNIEPAVLGLPNSCKRNRVASPPPPPPAWQQQQQQDVNKMRSPKQQRIISNEQQSPIPQAMPVLQQQQQQQNRTPKQRTQQKRQTRPMPPVWQHDEQQQQQPQQKQQQQQQQKQLQPQQKQLQQKQLLLQQKQNQQQQLQQRQQQHLLPRQQLHQRQQQQQLHLQQRQQQQQQQLQQRQQQQQQHLKQQNHNSNMNKNRIQKQQRQQPYVKLAHGQQYPMPFNNPLQRVPNGLLLQRNPLQSQCVKLLDGMERGNNRITSDATAPSVYWSRETMQHLDDLFKIPVNPETVERLHRVLERSRRGQLSHNDYRAVIKLKSLMVPH